MLPDGTVLVTAGVEGTGGPFAESYNPQTAQWSAASSGLAPCTAGTSCRLRSSATLLADGDVLVAGGSVGQNSNSGSTTAAVLYNPTTDTWTTTGSMSAGRQAQTATLLTNGHVLLAGGVSFAQHKATVLASADLYTP